jgi:acetyl-CoA carboxylase carboxyltransferase component
MMLAGRYWRDKWESGFFDRHSWSEIMQEYAPSAIVGRARLGGIPVGVIAAEMRPMDVKVPADPGEMDSSEKIVHQTGHVMYPDTALKIAKAIKDFNKEELPLIIFANWREISSIQSSMLAGVLDFTTMIVEALREYKQPVLVYLPPHAEMRGGTWSLFSSFINPQFIEMYADAETKAGSHDPESVVERKFRSRDIKKVIHRLDPKIVDVSLFMICEYF